MNFKHRGQAAQDLFVWKLLVETGLVPKGLFLDIGAGYLAISNTYALEQQCEWTGWCLDNSQDALAESWDAHRSATFMCCDATRVNYDFLPPIVDYASIDIDGATFSALCQLPFDKTRFRVIVAEHDYYSRGESLRTPMISLLTNAGYDILCADVCHEGKSFEIWAVMPDLVDMSIANKFRRDKPTEWKEILGL